MPDTIGAARLLLRDWSHFNLGYATMPLYNAKSATDKKRWEATAAEVDALAPVLDRKAWKARWQGHTVRLRDNGSIFKNKVVFAPLPDVEDDVEDGEVEHEVDIDEDGDDNDDEDLEDVDEEDVDEDVDEGDVDEEDLDDEDLDDEDLDDEEADEQDLDDDDLDEDLGDEDLDDDVDDDEEELPRGKRTKRVVFADQVLKRLKQTSRAAPAKVAKAAPAKATKAAKAAPVKAAKSKGPKSTKSKPASSRPAPGEKYDINAYF